MPFPRRRPAAHYRVLPATYAPSLFFHFLPFSNGFQVMNPPPAATSSHSKLPSSGHSTTPDHIIDITDRPYTHAPPHGLVFPYPHIQPRIHKTQYPADRRSVPHASSGFIPRELAPDSQSRHKAEHGIGPSSFPGGERTSYLVPLSPRMVPDTTRSALRLSLEGKSIRTRSCKKRHKCKVCGSYWERPSFLKIHMVSHTGVKGVL